MNVEASQPENLHTAVPVNTFIQTYVINPRNFFYWMNQNYIHLKYILLDEAKLYSIQKCYI